MPSLQDIRVRISSVKSTQKITQAMKMVAAAKLRRAQNAAENSRPYSSGMSKIINNLNNGVIDKNMQPKLLVGHPEKGNITLVVVATSERGLCGGFNSSIIKKTKDFLTNLSNENRDFKIFCIGKKGVDALNRQYGNKIIEVVDMKNIKKLDFIIAQNIASKIINLFNKDEFSESKLFFSKFKSVMTQTPVELSLIPFLDSGEDQDTVSLTTDNDSGEMYEAEPELSEVLNRIVPFNIAVQIYSALLENAASEQGARMTAMDSASRNAGEMIDELTLSYNRSRQAVITKELIEIISGAEAL